MNMHIWVLIRDRLRHQCGLGDLIATWKQGFGQSKGPSNSQMVSKLGELCSFGAPQLQLSSEIVDETWARY